MVVDIQAIHTGPIFGVFIETGASVPIANALLNESGASKTVYMSESPYNQQYVTHKYGLDPNIRSVSPQFVIKVLDYYQELIDNNTINTIYVSTFQVSNEDSTMLTHGWIGLNYNNNIVLYHISDRYRLLSRKRHIINIKEIGLKLLSSMNLPLMNINDLCVDIIIPNNTNNVYNIYNYMSVNDIICWNLDFVMVRAEDLFRDNKHIWIHNIDINNIDDSPLPLPLPYTANSTIVYLKVDPETINYNYNYTMRYVKSICNAGYCCTTGMMSNPKVYFETQFPNLLVN